MFMLPGSEPDLGFSYVLRSAIWFERIDTIRLMLDWNFVLKLEMRPQFLALVSELWFNGINSPSRDTTPYSDT